MPQLITATLSITNFLFLVSLLPATQSTIVTTDTITGMFCVYRHSYVLQHLFAIGYIMYTGSDTVFVAVGVLGAIMLMLSAVIIGLFVRRSRRSASLNFSSITPDTVAAAANQIPACETPCQNQWPSNDRGNDCTTPSITVDEENHEYLEMTGSGGTGSVGHSYETI